MPIKPRQLPPKKKALTGFQKFLIAGVMLFIFLTRKDVAILDKIHDFFTLPITDPRVVQMGTGVWVIAGGGIIWGLLTIFASAIPPSDKSHWAFLLYIAVFGLILAHFIFPIVASIYAEL